MRTESFYIQVAWGRREPDGFLSVIGEWETVGARKDPARAHAIAAAVGEGIDHDRGLVGRAVTARQLRKEGGEDAVEEARTGPSEHWLGYVEKLEEAVDRIRAASDVSDLA